MPLIDSWYLSLPVGTLFAFRINTRKTLAHLNDPDLEEEILKYDEDDSSKGRMYVGYVRDLVARGIDIGLLASQPYASSPLFPSDAISRHNQEIPRKGLAINMSTVPSSLSATNTRPRASSHPILAPPSAHFSANPFGRIVAASQPCIGDAGLLSTLASHTTPLRPTASLPWPRAYAYRPNMRHAHLHRLTVGSFSADGAVLPAVRFGRKDVARADDVMEGLKAEENDRLSQRLSAMKRFTALTSDTSSSKSASPASDSETDLSLSNISLSSSLATSIDSFNEDDLVLPYGLPVVIDVFLDLSLVSSLPSSPSDFEAEIERVENLERLTRKAITERLDRWSLSMHSDPESARTW